MPGPDRRRELAAIGSVLVAIEDGIGLQAALDPAFDVDGALAMVETMIGDALARLKYRGLAGGADARDLV